MHTTTVMPDRKGKYQASIVRRIVSCAAIAVTLSAAALGAGASSPAWAAQSETPSVSRITINSVTKLGKTTLTLNFDKPITQSASEGVRASLTVGQASPATVRPMASGWGELMWCWGSIGVPTNEGYFDIQYSCNDTRTLAWAFTLNAATQSIIVGPISERGLSWWMNSNFAGQNAPHVVAPDYQLHGTMLPVFAGVSVDYNDYMTFRHNVGSGGTGSISFAGSVHLEN
jgi:hypothetical protein